VILRQTHPEGAFVSEQREAESRVFAEVGRQDQGIQFRGNFDAMKKWTLLATMSFGLAWAYFLTVFLWGRTFFGVPFRFAYLAPTAIAGLSIIYWGVARSVAGQLVAVTRMRDIAFMVLVSLLCVLTADVGYSAYLNTIVPSSSKQDVQHSLESTDRYIINEFYPRLYFPTEKNFYIHKPNFSVSGEHYGSMYSAELAKSPTLANSVFQLQRDSISIDKHGFRETTSPNGTEIFALGDSYAVGLGVSQNDIWVKRLERNLGRPIYNLGVTCLSPKEEFLLLEHMLGQGSEFRVRHLLWMIYEGNDLEDSYETQRPAQQSNQRSLFADTIAETLLGIPFKIRDQAIVNRIKRDQITFDSPLGGGKDHYLVDGVKLTHPLYHSSVHGYRLFNSLYLARATKPRSYMTDHPNLPAFEQVFKDMASLQKRYRFKVTVLIAPMVSRLYAPYFADFPHVGSEPYIINFVANLSHRLGFQTVNLFPLLQPYADKELLYFRDDDHWNARGNEVVAEIIAKQLTISFSQ
jgi:lysophospholipase L1-like esterase